MGSKSNIIPFRKTDNVDIDAEIQYEKVRLRNSPATSTINTVISEMVTDCRYVARVLVDNPTEEELQDSAKYLAGISVWLEKNFRINSK